MSDRACGSQELQMIRAARRLFVEKGFEETTMCDIAEKAGVNRSTLHYYFANKDVMFRAVFSSIVETLKPRLGEIMASDRPLIDRLEMVIGEYFDRFIEDPQVPGFIISEIQRDADHLVATAREMHYDRVFSTVRDALAEEMREGRLRRVPMYMVFSTIYGGIAFPFVTRNLFVSWFGMDEEGFRAMIADWRRCLIAQVRNLLLPA